MRVRYCHAITHPHLPPSTSADLEAGRLSQAQRCGQRLLRQGPQGVEEGSAHRMQLAMRGLWADLHGA